MCPIHHGGALEGGSPADCVLPYLLMSLGAKLGALLHCELLHRGHRWLLDLIGRCWILPLVGAVRLHSLLLELLELLGLSTLLS
jgi:hypothetical protein